MNNENCEFSIYFVNIGEILDRNSLIVNNEFTSIVALAVSRENLDLELMNIIECQHRHDWLPWKEAIQAELDSLSKQKVPVGYKWVFARKCNENNKVVRYEARLIAQGFSQRPGIDIEEIYSPIMDMITFRYLISMVVKRGLICALSIS